MYTSLSTNAESAAIILQYILSIALYSGICTNTTRCLPVIAGDVPNYMSMLLQAHIRKAGMVGTPSVARTTASSTVGTVSSTYLVWNIACYYRQTSNQMGALHFC